MFYIRGDKGEIAMNQGRPNVRQPQFNFLNVFAQFTGHKLSCLQ